MDQALPLANVDDLSAFLGDTVDPVQGELYLDIASGMVRDKLNQLITFVENDVVVLDPRNDGSVFLPEFPITAVSTLEVLLAGVWAICDPTTYTVSLATGRVAPLPMTGTQWPGVPGSWRVTYSHGWQSPPSSLVGVVLGVAARGYNSPVSIQQERVGNYQVRYAVEAGGFSPLELAAMNRYVVPRVA
jgi:hypothetical protein